MANVLQVNVRLGEGGAAQVARGLASGLEERGHRSAFAYGYGPHGGAARHEDGRAVRLTSKPRAAANLISYRLVGADLNFASSATSRALQEILDESDVVHLHAIHSYFAGTDWLFERLSRAGKPVVWTLHDQWVMTGRCAQPGGCRLWEQGCAKCPNLAAYPSAFIDRAGINWARRRAALARLADAVPFRLVACARWLQEDATRAGFEDVRFVPNSVDRPFWDATRLDGRPPYTGPVRNVFISRDLSDAGKVNWEILLTLARDKRQRLTVVGDDAPSDIPGARRIPAQVTRMALADIYRGQDRLIYTSTVDYFPLTVIEAIVAGVEVVAIDSPAAREFSHHPQVVMAHDVEELLSLASQPRFSNSSPVSGDMYSPDVMLDKYLEIYSEVLS